MQRHLTYNSQDVVSFINNARSLDGIRFEYTIDAAHRLAGIRAGIDDCHELSALLNLCNLPPKHYFERVNFVLEDFTNVDALIKYYELDEAHGYYRPFASTPEFPIIIIKREPQMCKDLYNIGLNIDDELADAERFGEVCKIRTLQSIKQVFQEMQRKVYLPNRSCADF